ncbi:MAG: hypothetical protein Q8914_08560, partial [Bacteroidota bacterium]|nr:hypothetical protein [Bacteroidota bacterium]
MKKSLLLALMLLMATSTLFADRSWNLRKWSAATIDSLTADTVVNWVKESSTRFSNRVAITDGSTLKAKGVPIVETNGLTFGATSASKVRIDFGTNPDRLMLNGSGLKLYVPNCLVGDTIYMVTLTASSTTARGVTTSSNLTRLNALATSTDSLYNKFLVTTAGTATFTTTGGLHFRAIKVRSAKSPILDSAMINENFSTHTTGSTALVHGFAQSTYYVVTTSAIPPTTGTAASATAIIDTVNQVMTVTGSGSGNRGAGVTIPTSGSEKYVQLDFKWFTGNPGSEANKLVDMNFCDASGNCILYFYTENWTGSSNHFHCLNLSPTTIPSGSNRDVPLVAINANKNTLFGQSTTAHNFGVNTNWYHIIARMDFAAKKIVSLKVVSGTDSVTVYNLPFITTVPTSLAKISCATYRNASANSNGTGTSGNGSNAYLAYKFDDIFTTSIDSLNEAAYEKTIQSNYLNNDLSFAATMTAGTKPAAGALGYASGAQNALTGAIATAKFIRDDDLSTATDVANARTSLNTAMATFDAAKLPISDEYLISVNNKYLLATDTSATWVTDKNFGTFFTVTTNPSGYVSFISENKYLTAAGKLSATAASYRMMVNDTTFKLNDLASRTNYVKVDTINTFMLAAVPGLVYKVQEYFPNLHVTTLPAGWGTDKYTKFVSTALNTISAAAITDTIKGALKVTGSGSGDRGIAVTMPTTGTETMVDVSYVWKSSSVMTESNKLEEMNLTDASGNSILYLYTENWPGEKCHIHCLNLKPAQTIGGSNPGNPDVAIAANLGTLPYGKDSLTMPIDTTYKIKARLDFTNKVIVSLSITGNGNSFTATNLPFISTVPASLSRINFATYRNANQNAGGVGTAGNGSTTSMTVYLDSVEVSVTKAKEKEAYYKVYNKNVLGQALPLMQQLASGKTPETGILGYKAGAKTTYATAVTSAKSVYDNASSTSSQLMAAYNTVVSALNTFDAAKTAVSADYLLNNKGKFLVATDTSALYADTTLLGSGAAQKKSTLWTVKTDASGHVTFMNGTNYLQPNGKMGATASNYRFLVNDTTFKLNVVGTSNYLTVGTDSSFSLFSLTIPIKPVVLAALPTGAAVDTTGAMIKVSYNQKIAIKNANGIKVNGVVAPATATGKQLIFDVDLAIKTTYTVTIDSAAIVNLDDETLVANALTYTFTTYSPYLRDKQTMLGAGAFAGTYALFGPGSANGYTNLYKQIAGNDKDSLWCDLSNSLYAQYQMILADTTNKVWNLKNAGSGKYLTYNSTTGKLAMSVSPIGWQISLNASSPSSNDYMSIYTFWPGVSDKDTNYQKAIRVDSMKILTPVANGTITTTDFVICPMLSLTKADIQNYTTTSYIKIGARNTGEVYCQVSGDNKVYASSAPSSTEGSHWKVKRVPNGRYIFQNRLTGGYLTYSNDSTVLTSATYTPGADNQEWVVMAHCDKSGVYYHTIQGKRLVLCEGTYYGGMAWLTQRNSANATASSGGCARMCLVTTGVTYVAGEGKPTISVPTVGSKSITISWNANREANRYIVRAADTLLYSKGDSIGNDPVTGPIYQQIPYLKDSLCFSVDTLSELNSKFANLKTGINYYFTVQAMDSTGLLGVMSDIKTIQTVPMNQFKPAVPTVGEVTMKTVALSWLKNEEATGYVVSYWTKADSSDTKKITTKEASCILPNILASTKVWATLTLKADTLTSIPSDTVT